MRFNDLVQTVLAAQPHGELSAVTLWRQCVDLLAQHDRHDRPPLPAAEREALGARLESLRPQLSERQRIATVVELGSRLRSAMLVEFFAQDRAAIAVAATARARLSDAQWVELLPRLTPTMRGVLRGRRDLGATVAQGLEAFGHIDLVLTAQGDAAQMTGEAMVLTPDLAVPDVPPPDSVADKSESASPSAPPSMLSAPVGGPDQIRALVDRIAQFTATRRPADQALDVADDVAQDAVRAFAFETDAAGAIIWVDQGPRPALIGLLLGETALDGGSGPDGHVAGAFARRSGFQNGRYTLTGGIMAGEWRVTAAPFFDPRTGRFQGYRGQARRPYLHEVATPHAPAGGIGGLSADSLRQLVHELRTPLNAILGFGEIIEQQLFGPASAEYRDMAAQIVLDARQLLIAFDDLDLTARIARGENEGGACETLDPALLVTQICARFEEPAAFPGRRIDIAVAPDLPTLHIDPARAERMVQHLLRTLLSVAREDETLTGHVAAERAGDDGRIVLAVDRPSPLVGMGEEQLLDPGYTPEGEGPDGPLLGLGFSLRLIRSLAAGCGGALSVTEGQFLLSIPLAAQARDAAIQP
ncbi:MAG: HAMP domain-containing sensor histidine kinase [Sphingobium sp.]